MASAAEGCEDDSADAAYIDDSQLSLEEFIHSHNLPQSVSVAGGSFMCKDFTITRGDVLLLQGLAPSSVSLSFTDSESGLRQEFHVSPDIPDRFLVMPPKDSVQADPEHSSPGRGRPVSMVTYPTVADLLMDCPTYFEANSTYDDPYLPGFSVKPGDRFHFVKIVRDTAGDKMERLQCRTEVGDLVCLSTKCKGNFTVLYDDNLYTLNQLIGLARVPRRLKMAPGNGMDVSVASQIPEKLMTFTGIINMSRPQEMLEVSPWDKPETSWTVPIDSNLHVRLFSATDYEEPVTRQKVKPEHLSSFVHEYENEFPVHAALFSYTTPPPAISRCLRNSREIIIHERLRSHKLFVKDANKDIFFAIDESVDISFVEVPRTLSSVFEMMTLPVGSQVRVLSDIAADFPEPFVLCYGDVLRVTKRESSSWKLNLKHNPVRDVPIAKCERLIQGGKPQKLKLPLDLEVNLVQHGDPSKLKVTKLADIFSGKDEIPGGNVSVLEGQGGSYPPLPSSLQLLEVLTDNELLVSPLGASTAVSPIIKKCVKVPLRHQVVLGIKRRLEFPEGYFVMPPKERIVTVSIECVQESEYEELVQAKKVATEYEDVQLSPCCEREEDARSQASSTGRSRFNVSQEVISRSSSSGTLERKKRKDRVRRISQVLNPKNWHLGRGHAAPEKEVAPPVPVCGILTLALQPPHAADNAYTTESLDHVGQGSGDTFHSFPSQHDDKAGAATHDDTYEDVNITYPPASTSTSQAAQGSSWSECSHLEKQRQEDLKEIDTLRGHHRRNKTDPNVTMLVKEQRPQMPSKSLQCSGDALPSAKDLERAPPVHHPRNRLGSSGLVTLRTTPSQDGSSQNGAEKQLGDLSKGGEEPRQIGRRKAQARDKESNKLTQSERPTWQSHTLDSFGTAKSLDKPRIADRQRKVKEVCSDHSETPDRNLESSNHQSVIAKRREKPKSPELDTHRKETSAESDIPRKSRSPDSDTLRKTRSPDSDRKTRSPDLDSPRKIRKNKSPDLDSHKKSKPPDSDMLRKPRSPDLDTPRQGRSPRSDSSRKPRSPDVDSRSVRGPSSKSRSLDQDDPLDQHQHSPVTENTRPYNKNKMLPDTRRGTPDKLREASPDSLSDRREQDRQERKKPSTLNRHLDQTKTSPGNPPSASSRRSDGHLETNTTMSARDSLPPPRRPRRKRDASSETPQHTSEDTSSPGLTDGGRTHQRAAGDKPAVPPKPALGAGSSDSSGLRLVRRPPPVAAPRKRAARIGSTEIEAFCPSPPVKPVLGRKRAS